MPSLEQCEVIFWKGQKRYKCPIVWEGGSVCGYDTHDPRVMISHLTKPHTQDGKPKPSHVQEVSPILDADGNQIVKNVPTFDEEVPDDFQDFKFR